MSFLCNVFNDPSNPWYYVVGIIFLLLIFAALAVYIVWSGKKNKANADKQSEEKAEKEKSSESEQINADATQSEPAPAPTPDNE